MKRQVEDKTEDKQICHNRKLMLNQMLHQANNDSIDQSAKMMLDLDPSIYQYDEVYDDMQKTREIIQQKKKEEKKQKKESIIGNIRAAKFRRDRETSISIEELAKKERIRTGVQDEEKFVTSSYMKVLEENKKFQEEQMKRDREISKNAVGGDGNKSMSDFGTGLYKQGFFQGGNRMDINEERKKIEQEEKIKKWMEIKNARLQKRDELDEITKKDIREQYNLPQKNSDLSVINEEKQEKFRSKSPKKDNKKHKKHHKHSRSRSHNKKSKKKHSRSRSRSHKKEKKDKKHKKDRHRTRSRSNEKKQDQQQQQIQVQEPKLTAAEKKAIALEKYKQRKLQQQQQELQEQQEQLQDKNIDN